ncbi:MAG: META domain-containing protein [Planctomycetota bacterium]|nr:META domain-containing protein [Planctomycetota bacterium]
MGTVRGIGRRDGLMRLLLVGAAGCLAAGGCAGRASTGPGASPAEVIGRTWQMAASTPDEQRPSLTLGADGRATGVAGVNRFFGTYALEADGSFEMGPIGATKMAGPPAVQAAEDAFLGALGQADQWRVRRGLLVLAGKGGELRFQPAPNERSAE